MAIKFDKQQLTEEHVDAWNEWRRQNPLEWPSLVGTNLSRLNLSGVDLSRVDLREADLTRSDLSGADLSGAILIKARLQGANLRHANLFHSNLSGAELTSVTLEYAVLGETILTNLDLRQVVGLEKALHYGRSHLGIDTIYLSQGRIPTDFLLKVGIPRQLLKTVLSLGHKTSEYHSCFISYSSRDQVFADRLYSDLQKLGVQCWFAPEDMTIGKRIRDSLDKEVMHHDKVVLVLSGFSLASQWVEQEVEKALERERNEDSCLLLPIALDRCVFEATQGWPSFLKNSRNIGDFSAWTNPEAYQKALNRLLVALSSI